MRTEQGTDTASRTSALFLTYSCFLRLLHVAFDLFATGLLQETGIPCEEKIKIYLSSFSPSILARKAKKEKSELSVSIMVSNRTDCRLSWEGC